MTWLKRILFAFAALAGTLAAAMYFVSLRTERAVGFRVVRATSHSGQTIPVALWYPTSARPLPTAQMGTVLMNVARDAVIAGGALPLVLISHGNGGGPASHADLAMALASAGYIVAAPMHPGDNFTDQSGMASATFFNDRTRQLRATIDYLVENWEGRTHLDTTRIAAFGFSAGGFTVLASIGAQPELGAIASTCATASEFACAVLRHAGSPLVNADHQWTSELFDTDKRIRAAVVAAPGLGFTMDSAALANIRIPVQLWSGDADDKVPYGTNAQRVRDALGTRVEFHSVPGAGHLSFLTPCGPVRPRELCADSGSFDRAKFHTEMNASVIAFLDERLGKTTR